MPQVVISLRQVVKILPADVFLVVKLLQCEQSSARTQPGFLSAINTLQPLDEKFNVANTPTVELHVNRPVCFGAQSGLAASFVYPFSCLQRRLNCGKIHIWSIHKRCNCACKFSSEVRVTG